MPDDDELCALAAEAMQRLNVAWPRASAEMKAVWNGDLRIFIDAPPDVADVVNSIMLLKRRAGFNATFKWALYKMRYRQQHDLWLP